MKLKKLAFLALIFLFSAQSNGSFAHRVDASGQDAKAWTERAFSEGVIPPFSFSYDGVSSDKFIRNWKFRKRLLQSEEEGRVSCLYSWTGSKEGIRVDCKVDVYPAFDAVKWVLSFKNIGKHDSGRISCQKTLDASFPIDASRECVLHRIRGSRISRFDFFPQDTLLDAGTKLKFVPFGGRSSDGEFPFYNIDLGESGFVLAVGWSGTWRTEITCDDGSVVNISTGLNRFDSYLHPGESFRTPSVCLLRWKGSEPFAGNNKFRRFLTTHICRKINGRCAEYPLSCSFNYRDPYPFTEYSGITELWARAMAERYVQFGIHPDVFWLDAGWHAGASDYKHGKNWANTVGNWSVDSSRFPQGMMPVSKTVHRLGAKFMAWFEPERVMLHTQWADAHPGFLLSLPDASENDYRLFDLGNPQARDWMTEQIKGLIRNNGIDYYRQDMNMEPDKYWAANDDEGRIGMKEVRHIEGLYAFWDDLLGTFPDLLIDNCASGGKRLDFETISRSAPLWRTDYYHIGDPEAFQGQTVGLSLFLPFHGTGTNTDDPYLFRSCMSGAMVLNWKVTNRNSNILRMQDNVAMYKQVKPYYSEDFYPLTDLDSLASETSWLAYEMARPSDGTAVVVAFRHAASAEENLKVKLLGLDPERTYSVYSFNDKNIAKASGKSLSEGFEIKLSEPKSSAVFIIK